MTVSLELEAAQTLLDLCQQPRTAAEISSSDYRHLMSGLVACSVEELQQGCSEIPSVLRPRLFTVQQLEALEMLQRDLQTICGFYGHRLRTILDNKIG